MKTYTLQLTDDELETIQTALRFCQFNHPIDPEENGRIKKMNLRPDFLKLHVKIYDQLKQANLFIS